MRQHGSSSFNPEPAAGHRERLRQKYRKAGHGGLLDYEKLELLLTFAISRRDVKPIAKSLLKQFGSLSGIMDATEERLTQIPGVGENVALLIHLMKGLCTDYLYEQVKGREVLSSSQEVLRYAKMKLAGLEHEVFMVIYLNTQNEVIGDEILVEGTIDQLYIHPRQLMTRALNMSARGIILLHNHPSGTPSPSPADIQLTRSIKIAAEAMRLDILDHLIITRNSCYSIVAGELIPLECPPGTAPAQPQKPAKELSPEEKRAAAFSALAQLSAIRDLNEDAGQQMTRERDFQISDEPNAYLKASDRRRKRKGTQS
jgi:UPF0758 protein RHECIAT_CH0001935